MSRPDFDLSLYLVTDRPLSLGRDMRWVVTEAVKGGCTIVQLREKDCDTREFVQLAQELKAVLKPLGVPLIINDRIDVALAVDADGVHIGQSDMPYEIARRLLGPDKLIGLSVESMEDIEEANKLDLDYIGISPIFGTPTKTDTAEPFGLDGAQRAMAASVHPAVGIGGMNHRTAQEVMLRGVDGIAVVSDICSADSPRQSSQELLQLVRDNQGTWSENAWTVIQPILARIKQHPFLQELAAGTLSRERFRTYVEQDRIYLRNYAQEMTALAEMLPEGEEKDLFLVFASDSMKGEQALHQQLIQEFGAAGEQELPGTTAYMQHTRSFFEQKDLSLALAAILPCMWVYSEVGKYLMSISVPNNPYQDWISTYSTPMMEKGAALMCRMANELALKESIHRRSEMRHAFVKSTELEYSFWNQAY